LVFLALLVLGVLGVLFDDWFEDWTAGAGAGAAAACGRRPPQPVTKYCWMIEKQFDTNQ
jgi:hypothetical protein